MKWEAIDSWLWRVKVPGGWLVKALEDVSHYSPDRGFENGWDWRIAMCFVPDPNHEWKLLEEEGNG